MIIWKGKGIFTFLSVAIAGISLGILHSHIALLDRFGSTYVFALAALLNQLFLRVVPYTKEHAPRTLVDQQTGQTFQVSDEGSLFFIWRRYWTYILLAISVFLLLSTLFT